MQGGSYRQDKSAFINLNDMDLYTLLKRTDSFIRNWEALNSPQTISQGQMAYINYLNSIKQKNYNVPGPGSEYPSNNQYNISNGGYHVQ